MNDQDHEQRNRARRAAAYTIETLSMMMSAKLTTESRNTLRMFARDLIAGEFHAETIFHEIWDRESK